MGTIHDEAERAYFATHPGQRDLFKALLADFDVTWAAERRAFGSDYSQFLLRPQRHVSEMFGFDREIIAIHANYRQMEPRIFQAADAALDETPASGRADPLVVILISPADNLKELVARQLTDASQKRLVVPIGDDELGPGCDAFFVRNRIREHLFTRDLYDVSQPVTSDLYYFGRNSLLVDLQEGVRSGKNWGLFGLRKMGKTSLLFKLRRTLRQNGLGNLAYLDLQDASLYRMRWWKVLDEIRRILEQDPRFKPAEGPDEASRLFREAVEQLSRDKPTVIALDEVEHIAPHLRMEAHWDRDFLDLWKTLRAVQNQNRHICFIVAGVNASVIETPTYEGHDNPLFAMAQVRYVPAFDRTELRTMVRTLGKSMGLRFEEDVYDYLLQRYGGHPALTRMVCSSTHRRFADSDRPLTLAVHDFSVDESKREGALLSFGDHILALLRKWYPDEHAMLEVLANGDVDYFEELAREVPQFAEHLRSYQLVEGTPPSLRIPLLRACLQRKALPISPSPRLASNQEPVTEQSAGDDLAEIGALRNRLEPLLRRYIKRTLKAHLGPERWIDPVLKVVPSKERERLQGVDRDVILSERLFLFNLITAIDQNWEYFKGLEACPPEKRVTNTQFRVLLEYVNANRQDAHAKAVSGPQLVAVRLAVEAIERAIAYLLED
ncbi:MAG: hypothetical protein R3B48_26235 [Kofleriaceae bacterium]